MSHTFSNGKKKKIDWNSIFIECTISNTYKL